VKVCRTGKNLRRDHFAQCVYLHPNHHVAVKALGLGWVRQLHLLQQRRLGGLARIYRK
jgi:hypothetical protein